MISVIIITHNFTLHWIVIYTQWYYIDLYYYFTWHDIGLLQLEFELDYRNLICIVMLLFIFDLACFNMIWTCISIGISILITVELDLAYDFTNYDRLHPHGLGYRWVGLVWPGLSCYHMPCHSQTMRLHFNLSNQILLHIVA